MTSQYDGFWLSQMPTILHLIVRADREGASMSLDVNDIASFGERDSAGWYARVEVSGNRAISAQAHGMALGKLLAREPMVQRMKDQVIHCRITQSRQLIIQVTRAKPRGTVPPVTEPAVTQRPEPAPDSPGAIESAIGQLYRIVDVLPVLDGHFSSEDVPENGIYFFHEKGETCVLDGVSRPRIVRVGTHREQGRLRGRLAQHYAGRLHSSIFRRHIGAALLARQPATRQALQSMPEADRQRMLEKMITLTLLEQFTFRCLAVESSEERLRLEEKLIATLAHCGLPASAQWLGRHADAPEIVRSGLWNVQHVDSDARLEAGDLERLRALAGLSGATGVPVMCFLPCCASKDDSGELIEPGRSLSSADLPRTWEQLAQGRQELHDKVKEGSRPTSALSLYVGHLYKPLASHKTKIIDKMRAGRLRLLMLSGAYGLVDAQEPIQDYDAKLAGPVATIWKRHGLDDVLAELLEHKRPERVYGFFSGDRVGAGSASRYREFFTRGVSMALRLGWKPAEVGCFYRASGVWPAPILQALGRTFVAFMDNDWSEAFVEDVRSHGRQDGQVLIQFDDLLHSQTGVHGW